MSSAFLAGLLGFIALTQGTTAPATEAPVADRVVVAQEQPAAPAPQPVAPTSAQADLQRRTAEALQRPTERNEQSDRRVAAFWFVRSN